MEGVYYLAFTSLHGLVRFLCLNFLALALETVHLVFTIKTLLQFFIPWTSMKNDITIKEDDYRELEKYESTKVFYNSDLFESSAN